MVTDIDPGFGWHEIADHTMVLRGVDERASLTLHTNRVLAASAAIHAPAAIAFDVQLTLPHQKTHDTNTWTHHFGYYGSMFAFAEAVRNVRDGRKKSASLEGAEGFELGIVDHPTAGACVSGSITSPPDAAFHPFPDIEPLADAFSQPDTTVAHTLQFGFQSSLVDPPLLDSFICDLTDLIAHLQSFT